jgi:hypothetical protein
VTPLLGHEPAGTVPRTAKTGDVFAAGVAAECPRTPPLPPPQDASISRDSKIALFNLMVLKECISGLTKYVQFCAIKNRRQTEYLLFMLSHAQVPCASELKDAINAGTSTQHKQEIKLMGTSNKPNFSYDIT